MKAVLSSAAAMCLVTAVLAGEHPACSDIDYPYQHQPPEELHDIARSCAPGAVADLLYARARHAELMADHALMKRLERIQRSRSDWSTEEDQVFLSLVEVFSAQFDLPAAQRASVLTAAFEHLNELAELRLRGYDLQARRLREAGIALPAAKER